MVAPRYRARTFRRIFVKTPGGRNVLHYAKRKPSRAQCAGCGAVLSGVPNVRARVLERMPKSSKRPERPYGGKLCTKCSRTAIIESARMVKA